MRFFACISKKIASAACTYIPAKVSYTFNLYFLRFALGADTGNHTFMDCYAWVFAKCRTQHTIKPVSSLWVNEAIKDVLAFFLIANNASLT